MKKEKKILGWEGRKPGEQGTIPIGLEEWTGKRSMSRSEPSFGDRKAWLHVGKSGKPDLVHIVA